MKNLFKLFSFVTMIMALTILALTGRASAQEVKVEGTEVVTIEEYEAAMKEIYAGSGITFDIVDKANAKPITKDVLDSEIARATEECRAYEESKAKNKVETELINESESLKGDTTITPASIMPVSATYNRYLDISWSAFGKLRLYATATATYNADTMTFMYINSSSIMEFSSMNLTSWDDKGSHIYASSQALVCKFLGTANFAYTIPVVGSEVKQSIPIDGTYSWGVSDSYTPIYNNW